MKMKILKNGSNDFLKLLFVFLKMVDYHCLLITIHYDSNIF